MKFKKLESIRRVLFVVIALTVAFIWIHSTIPRHLSAEESGRFVEMFNPIFKSLHINDELADHIVRKIAHFVEYTGFGGELGLLFFINGLLAAEAERFFGWGRRWIKTVPQAAKYGLYVGFIDESIQMFSGRGPLISDVWLDACGGLFGATAAFILCQLIDITIKDGDANES